MIILIRQKLISTGLASCKTYSICVSRSYSYSNQARSTISSRFKWFGIPVSLGVACLGFLQFRRVLRQKRKNPASPHPMTWQLVAFLQIPTRSFSRIWGAVMEVEIHPWLRLPLLRLYKVIFGCNMEEAEIKELREYSSFQKLFERKLRKGVREIDTTHHLVSPADGKILHFGPICENTVEQVKGVHYSLDAFLGPGILNNDSEPESINSSLVEEGVSETKKLEANGRQLYHVVLYLSPGDCHHFHSPANWTAYLSRHLPGELLTVAPWAARTMPGLFALNERVILSGNWEHGLFTFGAVGAYNVGSIAITLDKEVKTNQKGRFKYGSYYDKFLHQVENKEVKGVCMRKGDHIGIFNMGSSIVLIFEAPKEFEFVIKLDHKVKMGEPIGIIR